MLFEYAYAASSSVANAPGSTGLSFSPDLKREPVFFRGELAASIPFREAICALHDVVVSDLRFKPKDRTEYLQWYEKQQWVDFEKVAGMSRKVAEEITTLRQELDEVNSRYHQRWQTYYAAQRKYFDYLYRHDKDAWYVLDPVITAHPDQLFFECFSDDASSYGCLAVDHDRFKSLGEYACGTTNIDYSAALYDEFSKIRSYKTTTFEVDPSGFAVETQNEDDYKEVKIDLPESWVRGFLQVNAAMALDMTMIDLTPTDLHNILFYLRRHKETKGPRSLRFLLDPGQPIRILVEPWSYELVCDRSIYTGSSAQEIRIWGRRRLHQLERLLPIARKVTIGLLGTGLPSFYVVDLDGMTFTLGLSGWTANDWSQAGNFDLLAPRSDVDVLTSQTVFKTLGDEWLMNPDAMARSLSLDRKQVLGALGIYAQAGRVFYDMAKGVYRLRELSRDPLPIDQLRFSNPREEQAVEMVGAGKAAIKSATKSARGDLNLAGTVQDRNHSFQVTLTIDNDERLTEATCQCNFHQQNKLRKGPCEHILALRLAQKQA